MRIVHEPRGKHTIQDSLPAPDAEPIHILLRSLMHFLNVAMARAIPYVPSSLIHCAARGYVAGQNLAQAIPRIQRLNLEGFPVTIDVLGEPVTTTAHADAMVSEYAILLAAIDRNQLLATVSIKPSAMGMLLDGEGCRQRIEGLLRQAEAGKTEIFLDMEDVSCTQLEIDLFMDFRERDENLGLAVQAYLKRTFQDLDHLLADQQSIRLCKGIYVENSIHLVEGALQDRRAINTNFLAQVNLCFEAGSYVAVATHDQSLIEAILALVKKKRVASTRFEFQMPLGVCEALRNRLRDLGYQVRIYVPYGSAWYGYSVRRITKNPWIAGHPPQR